MYCEDYPCCGHTTEDPCAPQWYDAPDAFDTRVNPHALCDHENGDCDVDYDDDLCTECGEGEGDHDRSCSENEPYDNRDEFDTYPAEDAAMEFGIFGSET